MSRPRQPLGPQPGRLIAVMLRALTAELCEPTRYSKAKTYARDDAVVDIEISAGTVVGSVLGSRSEPYVATLVVDAVPQSELDAAAAPDAAQRSLNSLLPTPDELAVSCTCPDHQPGRLCKHAAAVLLVLADELTIEPELLIRWRSATDDESTSNDDRRRDGSAAATRLPARPAPRPRAPVPDIARSSHPTVRRGRAAAAEPPPPPVPVDILAGLFELRQPLPALPTPVAARLLTTGGHGSEAAVLLDELLLDCADRFGS